MNETVSHLKLKKIHIILLFFAIILIVASLRWQIIDASKLSKIAKERSSVSEINAVRGTIYSKDGTTLAFSEPRFDMFIWVEDLKYFEKLGLQTREEFLRKVAPIIDTTPEALGAKITGFTDQGVLWIPVAQSLSDAEWTSLNDLTTDQFNIPLRGFQFENISKRIYPEGRLASHIVGLTNTINNRIVGVGGIEGSWNEILNPIKGILMQESNAKGEAIATALVATVEPKNGSSIYTSIDKRLQQVVEQKIKEGVERYEALSGSVVVMDPKTGQIMALANYPDYDPNLREEKDPNVYGNRATSSPYEMGSVGKILTISTAVDLGRVDANTIIMPNGHQGCEDFDPTGQLGALCTWDHVPQPAMPLKDCFSKSDNICLFHLAKEHLSPEEFYDYLDKFGIGKSTGIDLSGESYGLLKDPKDWTIGDVAAMSYGHGYEVNVVQVADAVGVIPNNGVRMKPYIVTKIIDGDGNVNEYKPQAIDTVLKPETISKMLDMMSNNFSVSIAPGEWWYYDLKNYNLGVKSGTALIADQTGYSADINASFVGFDQSDKRTFIMVVKLEKPQIPHGQNLSFYNVRPLWFDTFDAIKDIIGVPRR